jgi:hypothetical protein
MPYKRDGFWMGTVQRLNPTNKQSNWEGAWQRDGPPTEVFSSVCFEHVRFHWFV